MVFLLSLLKIYSAYFALILSFITRFLPSRYVLSLFKRLNLDARYVWESERLYWLSNKNNNDLKLKIYYFLTPVGRGLPWGCAMESTFRIINLIFSESYLSHDLFNKLVLKEKEFIENNIENHSNNNHILFNYAGLILANDKLGIKSHEVVNKFIYYVSSQFNADGSSFEGSTAYHQLSLECIAIVYYKCPWIRNEIKNNLNIEGAINFSASTLSEFGIFLVGDNDSALCLKHEVSYSGETMPRKIQINNIKFFFGFNSVDENSLTFPDFGSALYKNNNIKLLVFNPNPGQNGKCGHNHNDLLSICLMVKGRDFIIDPGVFLYSSFRNKLRSSQAHSSLTLLSNNFYEPEKFIGSFRMSNNTIRELTVLNERIKATFNDRNIGVSLSREVNINEDGFSVKDTRSKDNTDDYKYTYLVSSLCLSPNVKVKVMCDSVYLEKSGVKLELFFPSSAEVFTENIFICSDYGRFQKSTIIRFKMKESEINWKVKIL